MIHAKNHLHSSEVHLTFISMKKNLANHPQYIQLPFQDYGADKFEESPIVFGDFIKIGASDSDRLYEELVDMKKVQYVLSEVRAHWCVC